MIEAAKTIELLRRLGTTPGGSVRADQVELALESTRDPCSVAQGTPLSLPAMGLARTWSLTDGVLTVCIGVTGPGCTFVGHLARDVAERCARVVGVCEVVVLLDPAAWTEADLRPDAIHALRLARQPAYRHPPTRKGTTG